MKLVIVARYQNARRIYGPLRVAQRQAQIGTSAGTGNRLFGLTDVIAGATWASAVGLGTGSGVGGMAAGAGAALTTRAFRSVEPSVRAWGADQLYRVVQARPDLLGPYAQRLLEAGQRGGQALAVEHFVLSQRDPQYRQTIENIPADQVPQEEPTP